jgi:signal transduction histidine kinase
LARGTTLVANSNNRLRLVSDSDARLRSTIAVLEDSRAELAESANSEAAQILAVAILQLRVRLHRIADSELNAFCQAVVQETERSRKSAGLNDGGFPGRGSRRPHSIK